MRKRGWEGKGSREKSRGWRVWKRKGDEGRQGEREGEWRRRGREMKG